MQYICLVYHEESALHALSAEAGRTLDADSLAYDVALEKSGHLVMAQALQSVKTAKVVRKRKGKTLVTGMNGVPPALRSLKEGNLAMTIELNPVLWGRLGVDVLASYLKGDKVNSQVFIKHVIIDSSNIDEKLPKG